MSGSSSRALSADDWETLDYRQSPRVLDEWAKEKPERRREDDPNEYVAKLGVSYDDCVIAMNRAHDFVQVPPPARAALAAFALHRQPVGFTGEDVAALRRAAGVLRGQANGSDAERVEDVASRVEALLPP